ncbi:uncharacterized protein FFNC_04404 [Fusarium fujikuroi]|nr:uncharacterized protein FFNC_04404 [Fusarium fujikuroi]
MPGWIFALSSPIVIFAKRMHLKL